MTDKLTPGQRSRNMSRIRSKDTSPEMAVRRIVHGLGFRYRLHRKDLPGKPDLTLPRLKKVIFVHGCFWHQHDDPKCKIVRKPKSRKDYWYPKLRRNVERDREHQKRLKKLGWQFILIWECEVENTSKLTRKLSEFLNRK